MKQVNPKKITYWLLGETAGRISVALWKRLWGMPLEAGGKVAQKVAQESIVSMQESIAQLSTAVAKVVSTYNLAQQQYNNKLKDYQEAERQAQLAHNKGNEEAARLAITKAIAIEKILPQLSERVGAAQMTMNKAKAKLKRETEKLEAYKLELENLESLTLVNQAMAEMGGISTEWGLDSARSQFAEAKNGIEKRALLEEAKAELTENPNDVLADEIDALSLEAEIEKRFKNLNSQQES
ncbi:PspA/IM30 family protein [Waterburya agarophytonicola K14]|uniref:PspA/IM30 family protein n=1 Tax=Waterburya agarophytonicola KI4 TaxID=2874699 RepID=A0A964BRN4_9CYAN|nr:PspA/IM30 family protein [Waterburya agarophytonicola]MCC0178443.1 PspA/IM30 family protein [Waterburya agarophytonicola KI4]